MTDSDKTREHTPVGLVAWATIEALAKRDINAHESPGAREQEGTLLVLDRETGSIQLRTEARELRIDVWRNREHVVRDHRIPLPATFPGTEPPDPTWLQISEQIAQFWQD